MSNYRRGADLERSARRFCDEQGALFTMRAAGSHGKVDVLAIFPDQTKLIQAKIDGRLSREDREALVGLATNLTEATGMKHVPYLAYKQGSGLILRVL